MTVLQLPSAYDKVIIEALFTLTPPLALFRYWIDPSLLQQWWPQQAECTPIQGGEYHLSWPQMNWDLRGEYTAFEPGQHLCFTWQWDHELQEAAGREVDIVFSPLTAGGTRLLLTHKSYADTPSDQRLRIEDHLAGWLHFLPRLQQLFDPPPMTA